MGLFKPLRALSAFSCGLAYKLTTVPSQAGTAIDMGLNTHIHLFITSVKSGF